MPILNVKLVQVGQVGVQPQIALLLTNDTVAAALTAGYLNKYQHNNPGVLNDTTICLVATKTAPTALSTQVGWYEVDYSAPNWSLVPAAGAGSVVLPTIANHLATFTNTTGTLSEDPATAISGGNIQAGLSGTAGLLSSFPAVAASGSLRLAAVTNASGNFNTTISNAAAILQSQVVSIPDAGQATANFILSNTLAIQTVNYTTASTTPGGADAFEVLANLSGTTITTGGLTSSAGLLTMIGASGGSFYGQVGEVVATGTLSGTAIVAGVLGEVNVTGGVINAARVAMLSGIWSGAATATNVTKTHGIYLNNDNTQVLNSIINADTNATYLLELPNSTHAYYAAAGVSGGSAGDAAHCAAQQVLKIFINGAAAYIPVFTQNT